MCDPDTRSYQQQPGCPPERTHCGGAGCRDIPVTGLSCMNHCSLGSVLFRLPHLPASLMGLASAGCRSKKPWDSGLHSADLPVAAPWHRAHLELVAWTLYLQNSVFWDEIILRRKFFLPSSFLYSPPSFGVVVVELSCFQCMSDSMNPAPCWVSYRSTL